jgi:hypothetical protein
MLLGIRQVFLDFNYWTFTIYGAGFSCFVKKLVLKLVVSLNLILNYLSSHDPDSQKLKISLG